MLERLRPSHRAARHDTYCSAGVAATSEALDYAGHLRWKGFLRGRNVSVPRAWKRDSHFVPTEGEGHGLTQQLRSDEKVSTMKPVPRGQLYAHVSRHPLVLCPIFSVPTLPLCTKFT